MRVPEVAIGFVHLRIFLLLLLDRGQSFSLLVPHPRRLGRLAADEDSGADNHANELKEFHIFGLYRVTHESSLRFPPQAAIDFAPTNQMNADELKSLQAPLKQRYRDEPKTASITLRAEGKIGEGLTCNVATAKALVDAGLHPATGGDGLSACSGDMLLESLVACAGVTLRAVATALDIPLRDATIRAEGDLDFRGTLAVSKEVPVGFQQIRLRFDLDTDASEEQLATLLRLTERYCVVYQTLARPPKIDISHRVLE